MCSLGGCETDSSFQQRAKGVQHILFLSEQNMLIHLRCYLSSDVCTVQQKSFNLSTLSK